MKYLKKDPSTTPRKPPKGELGRRGTRILETKDEKNNILMAIEKNKPDMAFLLCCYIAKDNLCGNNDQALSI